MLEEKELRGIIRMLKSIQERIAIMLEERGDEAKIGIGVRQYNAIVDHLVENDAIPDNLFITLDEDAPGEDVDLCCSQLAGYLEGSMEESGGRKTGDKNEMGNLIREAMPNWVKKQIVNVPSSGKKEEIVVSSLEKEENLSELESKMAELAQQMKQLAQQQAELAKQFESHPSQKAEE